MQSTIKTYNISLWNVVQIANILKIEIDKVPNHKEDPTKK